MSIFFIFITKLRINMKEDDYMVFDVEKKIEIVNLYRSSKDISLKFICDNFGVSRATLMRWNRQYDGTKESLENKAHLPKSRMVDTNIKIKTVNLYLKGNYSLEYVAKLFGVSFKSVARWSKEYDTTTKLEELS